jgi:hypothetical protein
VALHLTLAFPEAVILPGDPLARRVDQLMALRDRARDVGDPRPCEVPIASARRLRDLEGPAIAFEIPRPTGDPVRGRIVRHEVAFSGKDFEPKLVERIVAFLRSIERGDIESLDDEGQHLVLESLGRGLES